MKTFTLFGVMMLALFACKQKSDVTAVAQELQENQTTGVKADTIPKIKLDPKMGDVESDPISIEDAYMEGDILHLQVQHSGGCEDHSYELKGSGMYMKSMPPQTTIVLIHDANDDHCRALISKSLQFNLKSLQYPGAGKLILHLTGFAEPIEYTY